MAYQEAPLVIDRTADGVWLKPRKAVPYRKAVRQLVGQLNSLTPYSELVNKAAHYVNYVWRPPYYGDMRTVAAASGLPLSQVITANHAYELSRLGCTTRVDTCRGKLRLRRTLDWPLPGIGEHTVTVHHTAFNCVNVTFPGLVGALTGMRVGEYAVAINAAPSSGLSGGWQPLLLLRWVLENCETYEDAHSVLVETPLMAGVFFTLVGNDAACVIERTVNDYAIRSYTNKPLVTANHYVHKNFKTLNKHNPGSFARLKAFTADAQAWKKPPVRQQSTVQYVELTPENGTYRVLGVM